MGTGVPFAFNGGDDVDIVFCLRDKDGRIVNLTGITVTAEVFTDYELVKTLEVDDGVTIDDVHPDEGYAHGVVRAFDKTETPDLEIGRHSFVKIKASDGDGYNVSTEAIWLEKQLP